MKIQDLILQATQFLRATSPSARLDAEVIISDVLNYTRPQLYVNSKQELSKDVLSECLQKIERRIQGEPVAYITNKKDFLNYTFFVQRGVLVPRPETELLVEYALHWIEENNKNDVWILDLGCGSGNIGISLLKEVFSSNVIAVDISEVAIETTKKNSEELGVQDRISLIKKDADLLEIKDFETFSSKGFKERFDIVISNPPYIDIADTDVQESVKKFEPHEALFCENAGLGKIEKWTSKAAEFLKPHGLWIFEIGHLQGGQAKQVLTNSLSFENIQLSADYSGKERFVIASKIDHEKNSDHIIYQS